MSGRVWQEAGAVDWEAALRHVPLRDAGSALGCRLPAWEEWLEEPGSWPELPADVPALHVLGWDDTAALSRYRDGDVVVIGAPDADALHKDWFTHWLTDAGQAPPPSRYFVTGVDEWRDDAWQPAASMSSWYLRRGELSTSHADSEGADSFVYDPADPALLTPDLMFFPSAPRQWVPPPRDRRFLERRPDVLVYTSPELPESVELLGRPRARLLVSSDRTDTDFFVQLTDVTPSGQSNVIATGGLRARSRGALLTPGEVAELPVELGSVAHVLLPGHRLRVTVTSSWFPLVDRNLNTGGPVGSETDALVATNAVHWGSRLDLPVRSSS